MSPPVRAGLATARDGSGAVTIPLAQTNIGSARRSVSARLYAAFGALICILLSVGWMGADRMGAMNRQIQEIVGHRWQDVQLAREAMQYSTRNNRLTMEVFLTTDRRRIASLLEERVRNSDAISVLLHSIAERHNSPEESGLIAEIRARRTPYVDSYKRALALLLNENQPEAARRMMTSSVLPNLVEYHKAWEAFVDHQALVMSNDAARAEDAYRTTSQSVLGLLISAAVLACGITAFVTRSLTKEIANREAAERALSEAGDKLMRVQIGDLEKMVAERTAELNVSEAQFRIIAENVPDLVAVIDADGNRVYASPSYQNVLGISGEELRGAPVVSRIHPDDRDQVGNALRTVLERKIEISMECRAQHRDGTWRVLECHASPVRGGGSDVEQLVLVSRDITTRKLDEQSRRSMEVQLRHAQKMESIGQLAAGIAHEINTPTQYIGDNMHFVQESFGGLTDLLKTYAGLHEAARSGAVTPELIEGVTSAVERSDVEYLVDEIPKAIGQSLQGVQRVAKIVGAMKDFSHPGTDEKTLVDLNHAVDSAVIVATNEWKYVAEMVTDFDSALPPVACLPSEMSQVIVNMVVNASHAIEDVTTRGGDKGTITVSTRRHGDWVEIRIGDTGVGIEPAVLPKIFDPFFTTKGVGRGTGQGLAIAHSVIVDKHGGTIAVESEAGKGTTFVIRLPIAAGAAQRVVA